MWMTLRTMGPVNVRCREWVRVTGNEDLVYLPIEKLNRTKYVCERHFRKKDFTKTGNRLKRYAVSSLNLTASPLSSSQMTDFPLHVFQPTETTSRSATATATSVPGAVKDRIDSHTEPIPSTSSKDHCDTSTLVAAKPVTSALLLQPILLQH
ncbi:uncharacterized protein LOC111003365 [Pieris rapae]|uniref:uncharacterized protein LOC111003365 n=1 Tax=Pieris rapae TaxID=64459 RepID=UPI001E27A475|nr:uncharacterized protein LOC111003365 [Pieris rapae]